MSGWGLRVQWDATRHFQRKMWRPSSFLHQLSENGNLLLDENSDALYLNHISRLLGFKQRVAWSVAADVLLQLPAHQARRVLWLASYRWWQDSYRRRLALLSTLAKSGQLGLLENELVEENLEGLRLRGRQLTRLAWCYEEQTPDFTPIPIVDHLPSGKKRLRRRKVTA